MDRIATSTKRRHRPLRASETSDAALQATVLQRGRQNAVQIRKRRKEEVLRRKRGGLLASSVENHDSSDQEACRTSFIAYIQSTQPSDRGTYDEEPIHMLHQRFASTARDSIKRALEQWFMEHAANGRNFVLRLMADFQNARTMSMVASILLEITSMQFRKFAQHQSDNYYGPSSSATHEVPNWCDLFVSNDSDDMYNYLPILFQRIEDATTAVPMVETLCNVIGNIVLQQWDIDTVTESPPSLFFMNELVTPHFWSILIQKLPVSCYCCACILRVDTVHLAMDFLRPSAPGSTIGGDTIANLVSLDSCCVEAAWMLEGLTRREVEAVQFLSFSDDSTTQPSVLLSRLIERIHYQSERLFDPSSSVSDIDASKAFVVPALGAVGNIAFALKSQPVLQFQPLLVQAMNRLLEHPSSVLVDVIHTAWNLIIVGESHEAKLCDEFVPHFLPRLFSILTNEQSRLEWRRESVLCIVDMVIDSNFVNPHASQSLWNDYLWNYRHAEQQDKFMLVLVELIQAPDADVVLACMKLLDRLLRTGQDSLEFFSKVHGVDVLDRICSSTHEYDFATQELAASLMDDYFEDAEENESDPVDFNGSSTALDTGNSRGTHGNWLNATAMSQQQSPPTGRGRGRILPAWMANNQQQSLS